MPEDDPNQIPKETTPTWEMELLISGATVFGLMQLPGKLDQLFYSLVNSAASHVQIFAFILWMYAKVSVTTLILTFILHLIARGFWVALVGLHSVYPGGIQLSRIKGHFYRQVVAEEAHIPDRIERADNRATRIFGVGFGLAMLLIVPFTVALLLFLIALGGEVIHSDKVRIALFVALAALFGVPPALASFVDRRFGEKLRPEGFLGRRVRGGLRVMQRVGLGRESNPLLSLFTTNEPRWRAVAVIGLMALVPGGIVLGQILFDAGAVHFGRYPALPDELSEDPDVISPMHYASTRGEAHTLEPLAFIPDKLAQGSYLELSIPYRPAVEAPAMEAACTEAIQRLREDKPARAALDCLGRSIDIRIDGIKVEVQVYASTDPANGSRILLAMFPIAALPVGRHLLILSWPGLKQRTANWSWSHPGDDDSIPFQRIPFWR